MDVAMPRQCPACAHDMQVCMLRCTHCGTEVQGSFPTDPFTLLPETQRAFLETFIRCRGSLKDAGSALGISYPTARNRLDALIEALGYGDTDTASARRMDVLRRLKEGALTAEEALKQLETIGGKHND